MLEIPIMTQNYFLIIFYFILLVPGPLVHSWCLDRFIDTFLIEQNQTSIVFSPVLFVAARADCSSACVFFIKTGLN